MSDELINWRDRNLNSISPSFCAAKWYNASIHLGHGYTGSCHLPLPHPVDVEEIKINPSALHNTQHKKKMRKMMLEGVKPAECNYCWKIEGLGRNNASDRIYKSQIYTEEDIRKLKDIPWDADVGLKTLEISFDRQCNFACSYCNASYSTTWLQDDVLKHGPYQNFIAPGGGGEAYQGDGSWADEHGRHLDSNPYVDAFMRWYPDLIRTLDELRITGGEATVSQNFWRFVDIMHQNPAPNMRFAVNSNLGNDKGIERLIEITHTLPVKEFDLYTSNESYGAHAEYIRDGLIYSNWRRNLVNFIEQGRYRAITMMMTINSLSLFSITEFLDDMAELKAKYGWHKPHVDLNILRWPGFMSPLSLPDDVKNQLHGKFKRWWDKNKDSHLYAPGEKAQIQRLLDYIEVADKGHVQVTDDKTLLWHDFKSFYSQYDQRRNKNFIQTFPELADWYNSIELRKQFEIKPFIQGKISHYEEGVYQDTPPSLFEGVE
jgi:hypothetical protein